MDHGPFKSIAAAKRAGYVEDKPYLYDGDAVTIKGRVLRRNGLEAQSRTEWRRRGYIIPDETKPHARRSFQVGGGRKRVAFEVYRWDQLAIAHDDDYESLRVALDAALSGRFEEADAILKSFKRRAV